MLNLFIWNFIDKTKRQIIGLWSKLFEVAFMKSTYAPMSYLFATASQHSWVKNFLNEHSNSSIYFTSIISFIAFCQF